MDTETINAILDSSPSESTEDDSDPYSSAKEEFMELMKNGLDASLNEIKLQIDAQQNNHRRYMSSANSALWSLNDYKRRLRELEEIQSGNLEELGKEFDALLKHNKVEEVAINDGRLFIKTVPLDMTHPEYGETVELGQFEITIPLKATDVENLRVENKTNAKENVGGEIFHHPHVANAVPCFGSLESEVFDNLSNGNIVAGVDLLFMYLASLNPDDDYGHNWELWTS